MSKIIGITVGTTMPKPDLMQEDPTKGDYVKGKNEFLKNAIPTNVSAFVNDADYVTDTELQEAIESKGGVKTVNGTTPDENGNVEVTIDNVEIPVFSVVGTTLVIGNATQQAEGASY